jgi:hypothetical protein
MSGYFVQGATRPVVSATAIRCGAESATVYRAAVKVQDDVSLKGAIDLKVKRSLCRDVARLAPMTDLDSSNILDLCSLANGQGETDCGAFARL